jgi:DnaJ-class molecular chaperone
MTTRQAEDMLGLIGDYAEADVKTAAASAIKAVHPDLFEGDTAESAARIESYKAARDYLLKELRAGGGGTMETCRRCKGKGVRPAVNGFGHEACKACDGAGLVKRRT